MRGLFHNCELFSLHRLVILSGMLIPLTIPLYNTVEAAYMSLFLTVNFVCLTSNNTILSVVPFSTEFKSDFSYLGQLLHLPTRSQGVFFQKLQPCPYIACSKPELLKWEAVSS